MPALLDITAFAPLQSRRSRYLPMMPRVRSSNEHARTLRLANELQREASEHGAPWISFGDVHVDSGGNAYAVDRTATCYLTTSVGTVPMALRMQDDSYRRGLAHLDTTAYAVELPAYNVWHRAMQAGLSLADYGRTWNIYGSRADYLEGLD